MSPKFEIRDKVTSVLCPTFLGQIIAITERTNHYSYIVTFFKDDEPMTTTMYEFEIELSPENGGLGFGKDKERKEGR